MNDMKRGKSEKGVREASISQTMHPSSGVAFLTGCKLFRASSIPVALVVKDELSFFYSRNVTPYFDH